jgi:Cu-Zn family superoxide dismutase
MNRRLSIASILGFCCLASMALSMASVGQPPAQPAGKSTTPAGGPAAKATIKGLGANKGITGALSFTEGSSGVRVVGDLAGLKPGKHGFHIHENGDCAKPGGHFNPWKMNHGCPESNARHLGDLGNIEVGKNGKVHIDKVFERISLTNEYHLITGKAIIVHSGADDCKTQPSGASGEPIACGTIQ